MNRKFTSREQQALYDLRTKTPPDRGTGGLSAAYFRGLENYTRKCASPYMATSLTHAAFAAGQDVARAARGRPSKAPKLANPWRQGIE